MQTNAVILSVDALGFEFDNNLVITTVDQGSKAEEKGVRVGMQITFMSSKRVHTDVEFNDAFQNYAQNNDEEKEHPKTPVKVHYVDQLLT